MVKAEESASDISDAAVEHFTTLFSALSLTDKVLQEAGYQPGSSARHNLSIADSKACDALAALRDAQHREAEARANAAEWFTVADSASKAEAVVRLRAARLKEALRKYGSHVWGCGTMQGVRKVGDKPRKCTCGFDAALQEKAHG